MKKMRKYWVQAIWLCNLFHHTNEIRFTAKGHRLFAGLWQKRCNMLSLVWVNYEALSFPVFKFWWWGRLVGFISFNPSTWKTRGRWISGMEASLVYRRNSSTGGPYTETQSWKTENQTKPTKQTKKLRPKP